MSRLVTGIGKLKQMLKYLMDEMPTRMIALDQKLNESNRRLQEMEHQINIAADSASKTGEDLETRCSELQHLLEQCMQALNELAQREDVDYAQDFLRLKEQLSFNDFVNPEIALLDRRRIQDEKKQMLIIGFYGAYNFGDELMLQTLLQLLGNMKDVHVTLMLSENADYDAFVNGDVEILHYCRTRSDFVHLSALYDGLIIGGGALLDDKAYGKTSNHFISLATIVAELPNYFTARGKPTCFLGMSTNATFTEKRYIAMLSRCVQFARHFSVRDRFSMETMKNAGIPTETIEIVDDIALANRFWLKKREPKEKTTVKRCAVTWVNFEGLKPLLIELLEAIIRRGIEEGIDIRVELVPMYNYMETDISYFADVMQKLMPPIADRVAITPYPENIEKAAEIFNRQDAAINIRYHASLICACLGIPQTQVILKDHPHYPNKMRWIAENYGDGLAMTRTDQTAESIAQCVWNSLKRGRVRGIDCERARNNAELLGRVLRIAKGELQDEKHG